MEHPVVFQVHEAFGKIIWLYVCTYVYAIEKIYKTQSMSKIPMNSNFLRDYNQT